MNKTIYNIILAIISILCFGLAIFLTHPKRPIEYRFDTLNDDIGINDFYILDTGGYVYIPDMYYFENHSGKKVEKIILNLKSGNKDLFTLSTGFVSDDTGKYYPNLGSVRKINLLGSKKITLEVEYWFEGSKESETFSEVIELINTGK
ncbi:MAG: hypothetical protein ACRCST_07795 [Turicibacter sp.]